MQHVLTFAIEAIALTFPLWLALQFASYTHKRTVAAPMTCEGVEELDLALPDYDELFTEADQIGDRPIYAEAEDTEPVEPDFSDLLAISAPRSIDTRWLHSMTVHGLRTLGSLECLTGARRWNRDKAIAQLSAHFATA